MKEASYIVIVNESIYLFVWYIYCVGNKQHNRMCRGDEWHRKCS